MKHPFNCWICAALFSLTLLSACHKKDNMINPVPDPPQPPDPPRFAGIYKGKEYKTTKMGGIGNYWFKHDSTDYTIEVVSLRNDKVVLEGDTFQLDSKGEYRKPQFTLIIGNDSLYRSEIDGVTLINFKGKRD